MTGPVGGHSVVVRELAGDEPGSVGTAERQRREEGGEVVPGSDDAANICGIASGRSSRSSRRRRGRRRRSAGLGPRRPSSVPTSPGGSGSAPGPAAGASPNCDAASSSPPSTDSASGAIAPASATRIPKDPKTHPVLARDDMDWPSPRLRLGTVNITRDACERGYRVGIRALGRSGPSIAELLHVIRDAPG